ncbi:polysaccharide deacetylase family protein [Marinoscillum sp. MHG1-6]|uniref:polysaccharide deacetylase family protein n=1 Tax=Marinoscillum sp. MHG1-6 TaxID=2959627 RepID=UPI0021573454|nr:polysaccharide deacetylase family protein [Marinoscillum sp. MHG1-6]
MNRRLSSLLALICLLLSYGCTTTSDTTEANASDQSAENGKSIVCFVYHRFGDDQYPSTNVSLKDFKAHLSYLKDNGFQVLSFADAIDYLQSDGPKKKTAVITIDDGYKSFYDNALPLLSKFGFPATVYINTETVGGDDYMTWEELRSATAQKIEIGNHTHSHKYFLDESEFSRYNTFQSEIEKSQQLIKNNLGITPVTFAYPFGEFDPKMKDIVRRAGFKAAVAQNSGVISTQTDLFRCPRFPMSENYAAPDKFAAKADMLPLFIDFENPTSFMLPPNQTTPTLTLTLDPENLRLDELQCFIQGSDCEFLRLETNQISIRAKSDISSRRRTLYTITVPDKDGNWHWLSHLWINPNGN